MTVDFAPLHAACAELGVILFTVTELDPPANLVRRTYSSHPEQYPVTGTKPLTRDAFYDICIAGRRPFVANTVEEFSHLFADHALITSMGLGATANFPVWDAQGIVRFTVNLLSSTGHFTDSRVAQYGALIASARLLDS